jgi:hypothetical protein
MKRIQLRKSHILTGLVIGFSVGFQPVLADEQDLEKTLQRMEQLLLQQQQELEVQRKELAEQRVLIQQLQDGQVNQANPPAAISADISTDSSLAVQDSKQQDDPVSTKASPELVAESVLQETPSSVGPDSNTGQEQALAERARRDLEGEEVTDDSSLEILMDPSNTVYDPDFPGAWHLPGTTAAMKIGGYVNLTLINSFDPMFVSDRFIVGSIPPDGEDVTGAKSGTDVTANQTRINYEVREQTSQGPLRAFIEADFEGEEATFRLRHAFGQFKSVLAGQTWSTMMDINSRPEEVDFEGINGEILARQAQVRLFPSFGENFSFKIALEDPRTEVINGNGSKGRADIVVSLDRLEFDESDGPVLAQLGGWNSRVAFILRDLRADWRGTTPGEGTAANARGWGVTTSGRKSVQQWGEEDFLLWQITYGKGIGRYLNDLNTVGGGDAVFNPEGKLEPFPVFAGYLSYQHRWPKTFKWFQGLQGILRSNVTFSWVYINNYDYQLDKNYQSTLRASMNVIYLPTTNFRLGMELLYGQRINKDDSKGTALQLQFSARYNF